MYSVRESDKCAGLVRSDSVVSPLLNILGLLLTDHSYIKIRQRKVVDVGSTPHTPVPLPANTVLTASSLPMLADRGADLSRSTEKAHKNPWCHDQFDHVSRGISGFSPLMDHSVTRASADSISLWVY